MNPVKLEQYNDYNFDRVSAGNYSYRWYVFPIFPTDFRPDSPQSWVPPQVAYWEDRRCQSPDYCIDSPKTPPVGKYITIQPRSIDTSARDQRMLYNASFPLSDRSLPLTKKRKGNNRYGQSGSHRCLRCQKGKRKVIYLLSQIIDCSVYIVQRMNRVNGV